MGGERLGLDAIDDSVSRPNRLERDQRGAQAHDDDENVQHPHQEARLCLHFAGAFPLAFQDWIQRDDDVADG